MAKAENEEQPKDFAVKPNLLNLMPASEPSLSDLQCRLQYLRVRCPPHMPNVHHP